MKSTFARALSSVARRPPVDSFSTANADANRVSFFGFGPANVGFLRTRAAGRKTRATGNPAQIRNGPRRCVRRKRAFRRPVERVAFSTFFPSRTFFSEKTSLFASVRVAVIDALRQVGRRLKTLSFAVVFTSTNDRRDQKPILRRDSFYVASFKFSNVPSFAVDSPR